MGQQRQFVHFLEGRSFRKCGKVKVTGNEINKWKSVYEETESRLIPFSAEKIRSSVSHKQPKDKNIENC